MIDAFPEPVALGKKTSHEHAVQFYSGDVFLTNELDERRFYETVGAVIAKGIAAARDSSRRVVAFGEMLALLWAEGKKEEAMQLEKLWNGLARSYSFSLRCAYPVQGFCHEEDADSFSAYFLEQSHRDGEKD